MIHPRTRYATRTVSPETEGSVRIVDMPDLGAFTADSSIVGERAGSGRFSATSLGGYFFTVTGGTVTGGTGFAADDWLTPLVNWPVVSSHVYALSPDGRMAITGASDTEHSAATTSPVAIGVSGFGYANRVTADPTVSAWGGYFEARQYPSVTSSAFGIEVDVANVSGLDAPMPTPYAEIGPLTVGIQLASGAGTMAGLPALAADAASAGMYIVHNGAAFRAGIVIGSNAVYGTDGTGTGSGTAISMATGHAVTWTKPDNTPGPLIISVQTAGTPAQMVFDDDQVYWRDTVQLLGILTGTPALNTTSMMLRVHNNAGPSYVPVILGGPNSAGAGYRWLMVPN